jgi:hypothetical protein
MNEVATALYTTLTNGTTVTGLLSGTTAVYDRLAPEGAALPYVVFSLQAGGPVNQYPDDARELYYFVRAYALTGKSAGAIDAAVSAKLHRQNISVTGWNTVWCARSTDLENVETPAGKAPVYMNGAIYRIRIV